MTKIRVANISHTYHLNPVYFKLATIFHYITNAAPSKLPLYKTKAATILTQKTLFIHS